MFAFATLRERYSLVRFRAKPQRKAEGAKLEWSTTKKIALIAFGR